MQQEKNLDEAYKYLEDYDRLGTYPDQKRKVCLTLSLAAIEKLKTINNKSGFIDQLILES